MEKAQPWIQLGYAQYDDSYEYLDGSVELNLI